MSRRRVRPLDQAHLFDLVVQRARVALPTAGHYQQELFGRDCLVPAVFGAQRMLDVHRIHHNFGPYVLHRVDDELLPRHDIEVAPEYSLRIPSLHRAQRIDLTFIGESRMLMWEVAGWDGTRSRNDASSRTQAFHGWLGDIVRLARARSPSRREGSTTTHSGAWLYMRDSVQSDGRLHSIQSNLDVLRGGCELRVKIPRHKDIVADQAQRPSPFDEIDDNTFEWSTQFESPLSAVAFTPNFRLVPPRLRDLWFRRNVPVVARVVIHRAQVGDWNLFLAGSISALELDE